MNLAELLHDAAAQHPDRPAVELGDDQLTFGRLDRLAGRLASLLTALGTAPGDRIGLMLGNGMEFPALYYAILRAGCIVVPMNPQLKEREIRHVLADSGTRLLFAAAGLEAEARPAAEGAGATLVPVAPGGLEPMTAEQAEAPRAVAQQPGDTAVILYTSGTTGKPKGAQLTHANLRHNAEVCARGLFRLTPDDVVLGCLPLFHAFGQTCAMNAAVVAGARLRLLPRFEPGAVLDAMESRGVTVFAGVPTMYAAVLNERRQGGDRDASALRLCVCGGSALPVELLRGFEETFDCPILEGFGMSETSPVASFNHLDRPRKAGSIGTPVEGVEMRIADEHDGIGEICVRGANVMTGYWGRPEATAEALVDGWLHTGDLGRVDEDGYYYLVDRKKDLIIRGGYNVYPREIEEVLHEHPDVLEVAVVGVPHPSLGQEVGAAVVLREGSAATADEIREHVRARVANYKYPREVWLSDALPKGATGKILKREIAPAPAPAAGA